MARRRKGGSRMIRFRNTGVKEIRDKFISLMVPKCFAGPTQRVHMLLMHSTADRTLMALRAMSSLVRSAFALALASADTRSSSATRRSAASTFGMRTVSRRERTIILVRVCIREREGIKAAFLKSGYVAKKNKTSK